MFSTSYVSDISDMPSQLKQQNYPTVQLKLTYVIHALKKSKKKKFSAAQNTKWLSQWRNISSSILNMLSVSMSETKQTALKSKLSNVSAQGQWAPGFTFFMGPSPPPSPFFPLSNIPPTLTFPPFSALPIHF